MSEKPRYRTDRHNNPCALTTDIAKQAGLRLNVDYEIGEPFTESGTKCNTARLNGDPVEKTIKIIDAIGFYTKKGQQRWIYIGIPKFVWDSLDFQTKKEVIAFMYQHEGGTEMKGLFL